MHRNLSSSIERWERQCQFSLSSACGKTAQHLRKQTKEESEAIRVPTGLVDDGAKRVRSRVLVVCRDEEGDADSEDCSKIDKDEGLGDEREVLGCERVEEAVDDEETDEEPDKLAICDLVL